MEKKVLNKGVYTIGAYIVIKAKQVYLGYYDTAEEAFNAYKKAKEANIKSMAEEYKDRIPKEVYNSLLNYTVNITD